ncbi:hypothetical protein SVIOM74S_10078 [Streptomyces violarus]
MSLLSARRLMAAHIAFVTVATIVCMTVQASAPALCAAIGLSGVVAVLIGIRLHARGTRLASPAALDPGLATALDGLPTVLVCPMTQPDRPPGTVPGVLLVAAYPLAPRDRVGFRIQLTALNSDDGIARLNGTLTRLSERFPLRLKG